MVERVLYPTVFSQNWGRQMRFITGPRQCGKTTLAKTKLKEEKSSHLYYLWDLREVRNRYKTNQLFFTEDVPPSHEKAWVCFDEIHKIPKWKNALKAIFDSTQEHYHFIITGSAKFEIFKKAGDSLSGRYFSFHLYPLSLSELSFSKHKEITCPTSATEWVLSKLDKVPTSQDTFKNLLEFGGFPEPFLKQSKIFQSKWQEDYIDTVIKEDIGALTRIIDKEYLYDLYRLLPQMVASPISESSLASHLELSSPTLKNYLKRLEDFYLTFRIHPYTKNIKRSLLKAPKCYLYDWSMIHDDAKRFENYVACEWKAQLSLWSESSENRYQLFYLRNKQMEETDFLILKDGIPWLMIESKFSDGPIAGHHYKMQSQLQGVPMVQVCRQEGVAQMESKNVFRISASRLFA